MDQEYDDDDTGNNAWDDEVVPDSQPPDDYDHQGGYVLDDDDSTPYTTHRDHSSRYNPNPSRASGSRPARNNQRYDPDPPRAYKRAAPRVADEDQDLFPSYMDPPDLRGYANSSRNSYYHPLPPNYPPTSGHNRRPPPPPAYPYNDRAPPTRNGDPRGQPSYGARDRPPQQARPYPQQYQTVAPYPDRGPPKISTRRDPPVSNPRSSFDEPVPHPTPSIPRQQPANQSTPKSSLPRPVWTSRTPSIQHDSRPPVLRGQAPSPTTAGMPKQPKFAPAKTKLLNSGANPGAQRGSTLPKPMQPTLAPTSKSAPTHPSRGSAPDGTQSSLTSISRTPSLVSSAVPRVSTSAAGPAARALPPNAPGNASSSRLDVSMKSFKSGSAMSLSTSNRPAPLGASTTTLSSMELDGPRAVPQEQPGPSKAASSTATRALRPRTTDASAKPAAAPSSASFIPEPTTPGRSSEPRLAARQAASKLAAASPVQINPGRGKDAQAYVPGADEDSEDSSAARNEPSSSDEPEDAAEEADESVEEDEAGAGNMNGKRGAKRGSITTANKKAKLSNSLSKAAQTTSKAPSTSTAKGKGKQKEVDSASTTSRAKSKQKDATETEDQAVPPPKKGRQTKVNTEEPPPQAQKRNPKLTAQDGMSLAKQIAGAIQYRADREVQVAGIQALTAAEDRRRAEADLERARCEEATEHLRIQLVELAIKATSAGVQFPNNWHVARVQQQTQADRADSPTVSDT